MSSKAASTSNESSRNGDYCSRYGWLAKSGGACQVDVLTSPAAQFGRESIIDLALPAKRCSRPSEIDGVLERDGPMTILGLAWGSGVRAVFGFDILQAARSLGSSRFAC